MAFSYLYADSTKPGTGAGLRMLRAVCRDHTVGVDFSAGMLAEAARNGPASEWVRADVRNLRFAAELDLAVSFGAPGHFLPGERPALPGERPALPGGVHRALRSGGVFAFLLVAPLPVTVAIPPAAVHPSWQATHVGRRAWFAGGRGSRGRCWALLARWLGVMPLSSGAEGRWRCR